MIKIHNYNELLDMESEFPKEFVKYLKEEFHFMHEYFGNGTKLMDFKLESFNALVIFESHEECVKTIKLERLIEYLEEVQLTYYTVLRLGINMGEDVQLHYYLKG